ncbi:MAG: sugar phosphate isomerase/epimerase [Candidatus Omnitrophica bacterium]|nr:sugar phosphate isomerase/epimerase [Candidatus Omnitrophota bacterium]
MKTDSLALSTSWKALQYSRAKDIIVEIKALGFYQVELSFNLSRTLVEEMINLKDQGLIEVVSVHNFCPVPCGIAREKALPDTFSLSAQNEQERKKAVAYTKESIDTASRIGAKAVVLHLGKVKIKERIKTLALYFLKNDSAKYNKLKIQMVKEREKKSKIFFEQALRSLEQLTEYAQTKNVKLGIENRYYFSEIPNIEEMEIILRRFSNSTLYYWHDVGHAQVYENLGILKHRDILDKFSPRMLGIHLHDIEGIDDHRAPLEGKFDFTLLKPYVKENTLKVLEPHYPATKEQILRAKEYLEQLFR